MKRILTGSILVPFFLYIVLGAPQWLFLVVVGALACICLHELHGIARASFPGLLEFRLGPVPYAAGLVFLFVPEQEWLIGVLGVLAVLMLALRARDISMALPATAVFALGLFYVFGAWKAAIGLRTISVWWMLFATAINWVADTFAYYGGRAFGKHKLAPRISPGKSWEGTLCSLLSAIVLGGWYLRHFFPELGMWQVVSLCAAANIAGQLGDLAESALKRGAGVKDSGTLLPGHGGWLDRTDSSLFSMPLVYFVLQQPWWKP